MASPGVRRESDRIALAPDPGRPGVYHSDAMSEHAEQLKDLAERIAAARGFL